MAKDKKDAVEEPTAPVPAVVASNLPSGPVGGYDVEDLGAGFEDMSKDDFSIPFLAVLQPLSPQLMPGTKVDGAEAGMVFNSVTGDLYPGDKGFGFIPVHREHSFIEWIPRNKGGGFVARFEAGDVEVQTAKEESTTFGKLSRGENDLVETFTVYGLVLSEDRTFSYGVISFSSTQIKPYRNFMTKANAIQFRDDATGRQFTAPLFSHVYRAKSKFMQNEKGSWFGWDIAFDGANARECRLEATDPLFKAAKEFRSMVVSGAAKADMSKATDENSAPSGGSDVF